MGNNSFDAIAYFYSMTLHNKLAVSKGFKPITISGPDDLEGLLDKYRDDDRFVAVTDTTTGNLSSGDGAQGFFRKRAFTVFILSAYNYLDMQDREQELSTCRELFFQFVSKIIHDKYEYEEKMMFFDTESIPNQELGRYFLSGLTGLHFTLFTQEPQDLVYDDEQWT